MCGNNWLHAYRSLENARLTVGQERVEWASLAVNKTTEVEIKSRSVMGVPIPIVEAHDAPPEMAYSLGDTQATLDDASYAFRTVLTRVPELTEVMTSVWRLARELRKTQRRVNALKYIFIPDYEDTVAFIENTLEEREREETFRLKLLKTRSDKETPETIPPDERSLPPLRSEADSQTQAPDKRN